MDHGKGSKMAEETEKYIVRLLFQVPATSHSNAVERVIDQLARYGIMEWVYRSQRVSDGTFEHFNGDIEPVDFEELQKTVEEAQEPEGDTDDEE